LKQINRYKTKEHIIDFYLFIQSFADKNTNLTVNAKRYQTKDTKAI